MKRTLRSLWVGLCLLALAPAPASAATLEELVRRVKASPQPVLSLLASLSELTDGNWTTAHVEYALQAADAPPTLRAALAGRSVLKSGAQLQLNGPGAVSLLTTRPLTLEAQVQWTAGPGGAASIRGLSIGHPAVKVTTLTRQGGQVVINQAAGGPSADALRLAGVSDPVLRARHRAIYQRAGRAVYLTSGSSKPLGNTRSTEGHETWRPDGLFYLSGVRQSGYGVLIEKDPSTGRIVSTLFDPRGAGTRPGFDRVLTRNAMRGEVERARAQELSSSILTRARTIKSPEEVALLQRACDVTGDALIAAFRTIPSANSERTIHQLIERTFLQGGCQGPGFRSIVASGGNALTLHYNRNSASYGRDVLIKMDVGAELGGYSSDISRTVPADGTFSPQQRALYTLVLEANKQAIAAVRPGVTLNQIAAISKRIIGRHGYSIPHAVSHWVGLSVHDVGPSRSTPLRAGMVFTIEPGVYLRAGTRVQVGGRTERLRNSTGIRIEDVILVTDTGYRVLSTRVPKEIDAIEALMQGQAAPPSGAPQPPAGAAPAPTPAFKLGKKGLIDRLQVKHR